MRQKIYQFIFFTLLGWKQEGTFDKKLKKCIFIVVPHTSWFDFFIGVMTRGVLGIDINWVGKKELFIFPFNYYFSWMGGTPLNRQKNENKVDTIAKIFSEKESFRLAIAPEGTRKKVTQWKTGFYYIAQKANVPIVPVAFDWGNKKIIVAEPFHISGNFETDLKFLESKFDGIQGKKKEFSYSPKN